MKKFILAILVLTAAAAHAEEVTVLDTMYSRGFYRTFASSTFQVNEATLEGSASVVVSEEHYVPRPGPIGYPYPQPYPGPSSYTVITFQDQVKIPGLMLMGDRVVYHGAQGDVDCGRYGKSRVFKRPTIFLNGQCELQTTIRNQRLVVKLITK